MKLNLKIIIISIFGILVLFAFTIERNNDNLKKETPAGTIQIAENLFVDQTEISNLDWLEFLSWTEQIFGQNSKQYQSILPDIDVWLYKHSEIIDSRYNNIKNYRLPIVGITQKQAQKFLEWRSDRIFEWILIRDKIITIEYKRDSTNYFTIERYFKGKIKNVKPTKNPKYQYYPKYTLPNKEEFLLLLAYNDSLRKKSNKLKLSSKQFSNIDTFQINIKINANESFKNPTRNIFSDLVANKSQIYNLIGNVAEWLSNENMYAGKSWIDNKNSPLFDFSEKPTAYIGFRAICKYEKNDYVP